MHIIISPHHRCC